MADLHLGHLCIKAKGTDLELMLASSIKIAASGEDEVEDLKQRLTTHQLADSSISRPLLYCSSSLSITISLQLDAELQSGEHDSFIEAFSTQLRTARLWQQLHFSQPSVRTMTTGDNTVSIDLVLTREEKSLHRDTRTQHKLGVDVPFYDTRPPPAVTSAALEHVVLEMSVHQRQRPRVDSSLANVISGQSETSTHQCNPPLAHTEVLDPHECESQALSILDGSIHGTNAVDESPSAIDSGDEATSNAEDDMLLDAELGADDKTDALLKLLDAAVRRSICTSAPTARNISVKANKSFKCLSGFAPAVFRPQHLPAVASRAALLPTISKSLDTVNFRRSAAKLVKIRRRSSLPDLRTCASASNHSGSFLESHVNDQAVRKVPEQLWSILEKILLDSMAEKQLKPLSEKSAELQVFGNENELLDGSHTPPQELLLDSAHESDYEGMLAQEDESIMIFDSDSDILPESELEWHEESTTLDYYYRGETDQSFDTQNDAQVLRFQPRLRLEAANHVVEQCEALLFESDSESRSVWTEESDVGARLQFRRGALSGHEDMLSA